MSDRIPQLASVINAAVEGGMRYLWTCLPAKVVKWNPDKQQADCKILIKNVTEGEGGDREVTSFPVIPGVPVQFMGAGGFRVTCPISTGSGGTAATTGTLFFSCRSLDKWLSGRGQEVDPEIDHSHGLMDAIFMPGLMPFGAPWSDVPTDGMSIGKDGGLQMKITNSEITLAQTAGSAQYVALSTKVQDYLTALIGVFTGWTPVAQDGGAALKTALEGLDPAWGSDVAASKVKAE